MVAGQLFMAMATAAELPLPGGLPLAEAPLVMAPPAGASLPEPGVLASPLPGAPAMTGALLSGRLPAVLTRLPLSVPPDLLEQTLATLPAASTVAAPAAPAPAPCRFISSQLAVAFGVVPLQADIATSWRDLELQVVCDHAASIVITTQPAGTSNDPLLASGLPVQIRRPDDTLFSAHVALESDGRPLASRVISLPARSPARIPVRAGLQVAPGVARTPSVSGRLERIDLAGSLFMRLASEADQLVAP